jgi:hypothetical protein
MGQVIFLNTFYKPDFYELRKLQLMQEKLHFALIELKYATRHESQYQQAVTKISYHNKFRNRWRVINIETTSI